MKKTKEEKTVSLPESTIMPTELFNLQYGTIRSWLLAIAVEFDVFGLTVEKKTAPEIAAVLKTHEANTEHFLNALCALGLLRKENGTYANTELSDTFLVKGKKFYIGGILLVNEHWNLQSKDQMKKLVTEGPMPQQTDVDMGGDYFADHVKDMRNLSRCGGSQLIAKEISRLPGFGDMREMLDIGGAHGMDCIAIALKNPVLRGVVYDKPAVVEVTKEIIAEYEMEDRITVRGGDYTTDPIGEGYDLIYAKATLNFSKNNFDPLFEKFYKALNPGGVFVSVHDGLTNESTMPEGMVISWLSVVLSSFDLTLDREVIPDAMLNVGFRTVQTRPFFSPLGGMMDMVIGKK